MCSLVVLLGGSADKSGSMSYAVLTLVWLVDFLTLVNLELTFLPGMIRIHSSIRVSSGPRHQAESESDSESAAFARSSSFLEGDLWYSLNFMPIVSHAHDGRHPLYFLL